MPKNTRKYNLSRIKENYSYTVEQIADLFGINVHTVRRWIREEGLKRLPKTRPHLVHSRDLRRFLEGKQQTRKSPCGAHEIFCCKCRAPRTPKSDTGTITVQPNGTVLFHARCSTCNTKINRAIKGQNWGENHPFAAYLHDATKQHNGAEQSPRECAPQIGEQLCLNITP